MAINLRKGQTINLRKEDNDLSKITIGLGWKVRQKGGLLGIFGGKESEYDLDAVALLLDENDKIKNIGGFNLIESDVIFYHNLKHPTGLVYHSGDNIVGGTGESDDEQIVVLLSSLPQDYHRIMFVVSIYQGITKKQNFGMIENAYIRAVDGNGKEMFRYSLDSDPTYQGKCTMIFGDVRRDGRSWKFSAIGDAYPTDSFVHIAQHHLYT
jgi:tellurium resistance protein TerD